MINKTENIKYLYLRYLDHTATIKEFDQLFEYLQNPENLEILKKEMSREWKSGDKQERFSPLYWDEIEMEIRKRKTQEQKKEMERRNRLYRWSIAASLLFLIGLAVSIYFFSQEDAIEMYSTGYGEVQKISLDDGTQVTLNANSTLEWEKNWNEAGKRIVKLSGEAYFNVKSIRTGGFDHKMGFDVVTRDLIIQVIGTSFNVKSRTEKTDVMLDEGSVHLNLKDDIKVNEMTDRESQIVMKPGESVSYSAETKKLERAESNVFGNASWKAGTFEYSNETVRNILTSLEEIYGVEFQVNDEKLLNRKLTTNLPYSDWPIVESALELLLHARLEKKEDKIMITKGE